MTNEIHDRSQPGIIDRNANIDALRGVAFLAVVLLNLLGEFRAPFLQVLQEFHTEPGILNHAVDWITGLALDQKGFTILSFLFGVGIGIMTERNPASFKRILMRRFLFLLALGLIHIVFVFSGDILVLYAASGLLVVSLLSFGSQSLWVLTMTLLALRFTISWPEVPVGAPSSALIEGASKAYGAGTFAEALSFRLFELRHLVVPLLLSVWPRALAVMLAGFLCHKLKWIDAASSSYKTRRFCLISFAMGALATAVEAYVVSSGQDIGRWRTVIGDLGILGLASGYSLFVLRLPIANPLIQVFAPLGRMGLTSYLTQTVIFGFLFYGYGMGLFGKLGSFSAACLGLAFYGVQLIFAKIYFARFKQGPIEHLWRKFTYRRERSLGENEQNADNARQASSAMAKGPDD